MLEVDGVDLRQNASNLVLNFLVLVQALRHLFVDRLAAAFDPLLGQLLFEEVFKTLLQVQFVGAFLVEQQLANLLHFKVRVGLFQSQLCDHLLHVLPNLANVLFALSLDSTRLTLRLLLGELAKLFCH